MKQIDVFKFCLLVDLESGCDKANGKTAKASGEYSDNSLAELDVGHERDDQQDYRKLMGDLRKGLSYSVESLTGIGYIFEYRDKAYKKVDHARDRYCEHGVKYERIASSEHEICL